jgi:Uma2 family endonuclease
MATKVTSKRELATVDEYLRAAPPGILEQFEKIAGRWRQREVAGKRHQRYGRLIANELERRGLDVEDGWRVMLPDGESAAPDVMVVSAGNPVRPGEASYFGVPDLVVEILAADNDDGEDRPKKRRYAEAGVRYYWLVRLKWDTLETYRLLEGEYVWLTSGRLEPLSALPVPDDL